MTRHLRFVAPALLVAVALVGTSAHAGALRPSHGSGDMPGMHMMLPRGAGFDRAFIDNMVPHHQMAQLAGQPRSRWKVAPSRRARRGASRLQPTQTPWRCSDRSRVHRRARRSHLRGAPQRC
jgi:hypothetical protein